MPVLIMKLLSVGSINLVSVWTCLKARQGALPPDLHSFLPVCWQTQPEGVLGLAQSADEGISWLQAIACDQLSLPQRSAAIP